VRAYTVAAASVALRTPAKWVDNILSHHQLPGVTQSKQGVARRLTHQAILILEVALRVNRSIEIPMGRSLELAEKLIRAGRSPLELSGKLWLSIDVPAVQADLAERLAQAVEIAPVPRRGRPRSR
jgi:hypothetical protein